MSKTTKVLIISSVLLNVLLVGVIIGSVSHRLFREDRWGRHLRGFTANLPADKKKVFSETMKKVELGNRDTFKQIGEARERTFSILTAPEFDEAAYQVEVNKLHELHGLIMQRMADAVKVLAKQSNQEERKSLAEDLRHLRPPFRGGGPPGRYEGPPAPRLP